MAFRTPADVFTYLYSAAAFTHTTGATHVGMFKVVTDQNADQAVFVIRPSNNAVRHELLIDAAGNLKAATNWQGVTSGSLGAAVGSGWMWGAVRLSRVGGVPRLKFYAKTHPSGSVLTADLDDGGAEAQAGSPITYLWSVGEGVAPWVKSGGVDLAYLKSFSAALSDDEVISEMNAFAMVRATNRHSYLTGIGKANLAAALLDESGGSNNWSEFGGLVTLNDAANPAAFGGTQPTIAVSAVTIAGQAVTVAGTLTSAAGSPAVSVRLVAGASGTTRGPSSATVSGSNWTVTFTEVAAGAYTPTATVTDANGSVQASAAGIEIIGLSGAGVLPHVYSAGSITVSPASASIAVAGTQTVTVVDQYGLPLDGVVMSSTDPAVATVSTPTNAQGQATITGVAAGAATIRASFADVSAGVLSASASVAVALDTPTAPSGLTAVALGPSAVRLAWADNSSNETQFRVERASSAAGPWTQILTPGANVATADDATVAATATYFYRVRSANGSGASAPSNVASVTVPAVPDTQPPTISLAASATSVTVAGSTIVLRATASDDRGVTEVRFYRNGAQVGAMLTAPNDGASYALTQSFVNSGDNGTISYTARAWDAAGNSTLSTAVPVVVDIPSSVFAPAAPSGLSIDQVTATSMRLAWVDNATNETAVLIERRIGAAGTWSQVASIAANSTSWEASGLLSNTLYGWRVRVQGAQAPSGYSNEASASTLAPPATGLAALSASPLIVSGVAGATVAVTYTALNGNGSSRPGVTVTPSISNPGVASVAPANGVTDASGMVSFVVTFGSTVAQAELLVGATDGQSTIAPSAAPKVVVFSLPTITTALVKEFQAEQTDPKYAEEVTPIVWDYSPFLGRGELPQAIVSREVVPTTGASRDPNASAMLFGDAIIVGDRVLQWVRDGLPGLSYFLRCRVRTSAGRVVVAEVRIRIYRQPGARVSSSSPVIE